MAKIVRIKSELKFNKNKAFWHMAFALFFTITFFGVGVGMLFTILLNKSDLHLAFPGMFLGLSFILFALFVIAKHNYDILNAGVKGEQQTYEILKKLPKEFTVITNPVLHNRGSVNELDFVIIGTNGVFVVETKNYRGIITGNTSAQRSFLGILLGPPHSFINSQAWHIFLWTSFVALVTVCHYPVYLFSLLVCLLRECMLSKDKGFVSPKTQPDSW